MRALPFLTNSRSLLIALIDTIDGGGSSMPRKRLAEELPSSESQLSRYTQDPDSDGYLNFPLAKLIPLIRLTRRTDIVDYLIQTLYTGKNGDRLVKYLAPRLGYALIPVPRGSSKMKRADINKIQGAFSRYAELIEQHFQDDKDVNVILEAKLTGKKLVGFIAGFNRTMRDRQEKFDF